MATPEDRKYEPIPGVDFLKRDRLPLKKDQHPDRRADSATEAIITIYSLPAKEETLRKFCNTYLNDLKLPNDIRFELIDPAVYLIVRYNDQEKPREVAFSIPVWWTQQEDEKRINKGLALISPFIFSETDVDAIIDRELNGRPTMDATLTDKSDGRRGLNAKKPDLDLETEVVLAPDINQPATDKTIVKIEHKEKEQKGKAPEDLVREILAHGFQHIILKQFRDADEPNRACYQALVRFSEKIKPREISEPNEATVTIAQYSNCPIVQILDLIGKKGEEQEGRIVKKIAMLQPQWTLFMKVNLEQEVGKTICWRAGTGDWKRGEAEEESPRDDSPMQDPGVQSLRDPDRAGRY